MEVAYNRRYRPIRQLTCAHDRVSCGGRGWSMGCSVDVGIVYVTLGVCVVGGLLQAPSPHISRRILCVGRVFALSEKVGVGAFI